MIQIKLIFALSILLGVISTVGISYGFVQQDNTIKYEGHTDGWAVIDGEATRASMSFVGNGTLDDHKLWKLQTTSKIDSGDGIEVNLIGTANPENGKIRLTGFGTGPNNVDFVVILRGNFAPIDNLDNSYALDWTYAGIHWPLDNMQVKLYQDGFLFVR